MEIETVTPQTCTSGHEPLDYQDFETKVDGIQAWGDHWPGMMIGRCVMCRVVVSYQKPAILPERFNQRVSDMGRQLSREYLEQARAGIRLWNDIPVHHQGILHRYVQKRIHPGGCIYGLLTGNESEFQDRADTATWNARPAIVSWLDIAAPEECWGDVETVNAWLRGG